MIFKAPVYFDVDVKLSPSDSALFAEDVRKSFVPFLVKALQTEYLEFPFNNENFKIKFVTESFAREKVTGKLTPSLPKTRKKTKKFHELNQADLAALKSRDS